MKEFDYIKYDHTKAEKELKQLKKLLLNKSLAEREKIQPQLYKSKNLLYLLASLFPKLNDVIFEENHMVGYASEQPILDDYKADIVIRDQDINMNLFIELEDAQDNSIFSPTDDKEMRTWTKRIEHGYSQLIDWYYRLADFKTTTKFAERYGENGDYLGLLIIGRNDTFKSEYEKKRFNWRFTKTLVDSRNIFCMTYDDLYNMMYRKIKGYAGQQITNISEITKPIS